MSELKGVRTAFAIGVVATLIGLGVAFIAADRAPVTLSLSVRETPTTAEGVPAEPLVIHLVQKSDKAIRYTFPIERDREFHVFKTSLPHRDYSRMMLEFSPHTPWAEIHSIRLSGFFRSHVWKAEDIIQEFRPRIGVVGAYVRDIGDEGPNADGIRRAANVEASPDDPRKDMTFFEVRRDVAHVDKEGPVIQLVSGDIGEPYDAVSSTKAGYFLMPLLIGFAVFLITLRWLNPGETAKGWKVPAGAASYAFVMCILLVLVWNAIVSPVAMYWAAIAWAVAVAASMVGWGDLLRVLLFRGKSVPWPLAAAWGIAVLLFLGGVLNGFALISAQSAVLLVALGVAFLMAFRVLPKRAAILNVLAQPERLAARPVLLIVCVAALIMVALRLGAYVHTSDYGMVRHIPVFYVNAIDDMAAYAVYPEKILQTGSIGYNPYGERQVTSSFGGQYFLHTLLQAVLGPEHLLLLELAIGFVLFLALVYSLLRMAGVSVLGAWLLFLLVGFFLIMPQINTTSIASGMVLSLGLYITLRYVLDDENRPIANGAVLGLLVAGLCSLKNTYIPPVGLFVASMYLFYVLRSSNKVQVIKEWVAATAFVVLFVTPWLYAIYETSGDSFLGSMTAQASRPGDSPSLGLAQWIAMAGDVFSTPFYIAVLVFSAAMLILRDKDDSRSTNIAWVISGALTLGLVFVMFKGFANPVYRYSYALNQLTILIGLSLVCLNVEIRLVKILEQTPNDLLGRIRKLSSTFVARNWDRPMNQVLHYRWGAIVALFLIGVTVLLAVEGAKELQSLRQDSAGVLEQNIAAADSRISAQFYTPLFSRAEQAQLRRVQESVPPGEVLFAHVDTPLILDFERNPVHVVDFPSNALMPPSGTFQDHQGIAALLRDQNVRYLTYAYGNEAFFTFERFKYKLMGMAHNLAKISTQRTLNFQGSLNRLGNEYRRIYDDGKYFVLDLEEPIDSGDLPGFQFMPTPLDSKYYSYQRDRQFYNVTWEVESIPHLTDHSTLTSSSARLKFSGFSVNPGDTLVARIVYTGLGLHLTALFGEDDTNNGAKLDFGKAILPIAEGIEEYYQTITIPDGVLPDRDHLELVLSTGNFNSFTGRFESRFTGNVFLRSVAVANAESGKLLGLYQPYDFDSNPGMRRLSQMTVEEKNAHSISIEMTNLTDMGPEGLQFNDYTDRAAAVYIATVSDVNVVPGADLLCAVTHRGNGLNSFFVLDSDLATDGIRREYGFGTLPKSEEWVRTVYPLDFPLEVSADVEEIRLALSIGSYDPGTRSYNKRIRGESEVSEIALIQESTGTVIAYWHFEHPDLQIVSADSPEELPETEPTPEN